MARPGPRSSSGAGSLSSPRFREHHLLPEAVMKLGYGERQVMYAFVRYEMEERNKKVSLALSD